MATLQEIRANVKAEHAALVKHHPAWQEASREPAFQRGEMPLDKRPILLLDKYEGHFVADCAKEVRAALAEFVADTKDVPDKSWQLRDALVSIADNPGKDEKLTIRREQLNNILWALEQMGFRVVSTSAF